MKILVACEESQAVTKELRKLGHEAFSCDLLPCSGGHPEWHYQQDVFEVINKGWDVLSSYPNLYLLLQIHLVGNAILDAHHYKVVNHN